MALRLVAATADPLGPAYQVTQALYSLAEASRDDSAFRADEPYRRALTGVYARLAATYERLIGEPPPRPTMTTSAPSWRRDSS